MGIVIAVILLLSVIALLGTRRINKYIAWALLAGGLWNAAWYGLRHLGSFWGSVSILTGVMMVLGALHLLNFIRLPTALRKLCMFGLAAGFLLYAITIVQLNLGYPIIR